VLLCSVLYLLRSGLCFSLPGADLGAKAAVTGSRDADKSSSSSRMLPWMGQSFNSKAVRTLGRVAQHPSLAIPHIALSSIAQLDFAALKVGTCVIRAVLHFAATLLDKQRVYVLTNCSCVVIR
jgi:hypothetical protein